MTVADVAAVIHAVRQRSAPKVSIASMQRPHANKTKGKHSPKAVTIGKPKKRQGLTDDQRATLRTQWESGTDAKVIAARLKITTALLYYYVQSNGWKRPAKAKPLNPKSGAAAPAAGAPTKQPVGEQLRQEAPEEMVMRPPRNDGLVGRRWCVNGLRGSAGLLSGNRRIDGADDEMRAGVRLLRPVGAWVLCRGAVGRRLAAASDR